MIYITRREVFSAAHRLNNPNLSEAENNTLYDKCNNLYGHGHNYVLEVTVCGEINPKTGYLIDLKVLKNIIHENVIKLLDHKHLNHEVDIMKGVIPTSENLTVVIWKQLYKNITDARLYSVKIYETENNYFEYKGE